jgi:phospholipase A1
MGMRAGLSALAACCALGAALPAGAQNSLIECRDKYSASEIERLKCYDDLADKAADEEARRAAARTPGAPVAVPSRQATSYLSDAWLLQEGVTGIGHLKANRANYLVWRWTDNPNQTPGSPAIGHTVGTSQQWQPGEGKYQISVKTDLAHADFGRPGLQFMQALGLDSARLWFSYTQQSHWQALNSQRSAPFRETNYEPEAILTFKVKGAEKDSVPLKLVNLGLVHQSNGRSLPESRSWNRVYVQAGFETDLPGDWGRLSLLPRAWMRLRESPADDDNSDIVKNVGRGEIAARWAISRDNVITVLQRSNLQFNPTRGLTQVDWQIPPWVFPEWFPLKTIGPTNWYLQVTSGYGESMIDYNHRQNTVGFGLAYGL